MIIDLQSLQGYVTLAKDTITIIATLTATTIAIMGLRTWRKQLRGKTEYELARRLLRSVYKVRDAIHIARNPFASAGEIARALEEAEVDTKGLDPTGSQYTASREQAVYRRRWQTIQEAFTELDVDALEAEVIWGHDIAERLKLLRQLASTLYTNIQSYLRNLRNPPHRRRIEDLQKVNRVIYGGGEEDTFAADLLRAVEGVEDYLKVYLKL